MAILFADARGFSGLGNFGLRQFLTFVLPEIARELDEHDAYHRNSWGDGVVAFFRDPLRAARCALGVRDVMNREDWKDRGLPEDLSIRIGLHFAPLFIGWDPIRGAQGLVGSQVNLAARIEPVVPAGCAYATETFIHILRRSQDSRITWDKVGPTELAKGWGVEDLYNLRWENEKPLDIETLTAVNDVEPLLETSPSAPLLPILRGTNAELKAQGIAVAAHSREAEVIPPLIDILRDRDRTIGEIRGMVATALHRLKDARAVPALIEALDDPDEQVQGPAVTSLGRLGDVRALEPLIKVMNDREGTKGEIRGTAATSLHMLKDARAVPALIEALEDSDEQVQGTAVTSLGMLGDVRALEPLIKLMNDREGTKGAIRGSAATALHMLRDARAVPALIEALEDPDGQVKGTAVTSLGRLGDVRALEPLIRVMNDRDGTKGEIRGTAATALHSLKDARAVPALIEALEDPDEQVKGTAVTSLGMLGDVRALEPLISVMNDRDGTKGSIRGTAATALHMLKDARAVPALIDALEDPDEKVKGTAITSLGRLGDVRALEPLIRVMNDREGTNGDLRGTAATALHMLKDARAVPALIEALLDPDDQVAGTAASSLGILEDNRSADPLRDMVLDKTRSPRVRSVGLLALAVIADVSTEASLVQIARDSGESTPVVQGALLALSQMKTPSARSVLESIASRGGPIAMEAAQILANGDAIVARLREEGEYDDQDENASP